MSKDAIDVIKKQINRQTRANLYTDLTKAKVTFVKEGANEPGIDDLNDIIPEWLVGTFNLQRDEDTTEGISVPEFINYSGEGGIFWEKVADRVLYRGNLPVYTNLFAGVQLIAFNSTDLTFNVQCTNGIFRAYTFDTDTEKYTLVSSNFRGKAVFNLKADEPKVIIFTFYATLANAIFLVSCNYNNILAWKELNILAPDTPVWGDTPLEYKIVEQKTPIIDKIKLSWRKDDSVKFGGNGIYRSYKVDAFNPITASVPSTLLAKGNLDESSKWLVVNTDNNINSGDSISFSSDDQTQTVTRIKNVPKNHVPNPIFKNGLANWSYSLGGILSDTVAMVGANYYYLKREAINTSNSLISDYIPVSDSDYSLKINYTDDLAAGLRYDLNGYKINPSMWDSSANISITSTYNNENILLAVRSGAGTVSSKGSFYLSTAASYNFKIKSRSSSLSPYFISFRKTSDDTSLYTTPTLYTGKYDRHSVDKTFTPNSSSEAYISFSILPTTSIITAATLEFTEMKLEASYPSSLYTEKLRAYFYDSGHVACSTAHKTYNLTKSINMLYSDNFPSGCEYFKLGCVCSINSVATLVGINKRIFSFAAATTSTNISYSVFDENKQFIRMATSPGVPPGVNASVFIDHFEKITDRDKNNNDTGVVTWDDENVEANSIYYYYLDAYDTSAMKNRSALSSMASIWSVDSTPPLPPTNYEAELQIFDHGHNKIEHSWTNPTAYDMAWIFCFSDSDCNSTLWIMKAENTNNDGADNYTFSEPYDPASGTYRYLKSCDWGGNFSIGYDSDFVGDDTPPGPPVNFNLVGGNEVLTYMWTTPSDADIASTRCYSDYNCNNLLWEEDTIKPSTEKSKLSAAVPNTYNRYLTSVDTSGNESASTHDSAIVSSSPGGDDNVSFSYYITDGGDNPTVRNDDGWYSTPTIHIHIENTSETGIVLDSILYRYTPVDQGITYGWTSINWIDGSDNYIEFNVESNYIVEIRVKSTDDTYSGIENFNLKFDDTAPSWVDIDDYWNSNTQSFERVNKLSWNYSNSVIKDDPENSYFGGASGIDKVHLYKSRIKTKNKNPDFELIESVDGTGGYSIVGFASDSGSLIYSSGTSLSFNNGHCVKLPYDDIHSTDTYDPSGTFILYARVKVTSSNGVTLKLGSHTLKYKSLTEDNWEVISIVSSYTGSGQIELVFNSSGGDIYVDEFVLVDDYDFKELALLDPKTTQYEDREVEAWGSYLYYTTYEDTAENISDNSPYKYYLVLEDYRDKLLNLVNNSSFERYDHGQRWDGDTIDHKKPISWDQWYWVDGRQELVSNLGGEVVHDPENAYHGGNYYKFDAINQQIIQNDIVVLPFPGASRRFILSAYIKGSVSLAAHRYNNLHQIVQSSYGSFNASNWSREYFTFEINYSSINNVSVVIVSGSSDAAVDAVKLEETWSDGPTEYWDSKAVTADYLQGSLIRGHLIEADSITTTNLAAECITATQISSHTITADHIVSNTITADEIASDAITANELNIVAIDDYGNLNDNYITGTMIMEERIKATHIDENAVTTTKLNAGAVTTDKLQSFHDKHLYIKGSELFIEVPHNFYNLCFSMYNGHLCGACTYAGTPTVLITFNSSNTFNITSFNTHVISSSIKDYYLYPVLFYNSNVNRSVIIGYNGSTWGFSYSSTYNISYSDATEPFYGPDPNKASRGVLRGYSSYFYFSYIGWNWDFLYQITYTGTIINVVNPFHDANIISMSFDIDPSGNLLICAAKDDDRFIYFRKYSSSLTLIDSFTIDTYNGYDSGTYAQNLVVTSVSLTHAEDNIWVLVYRLEESNLTYYKLIDYDTKSIIIGQNRDVVLINNSIFPGAQGGRYQMTIRTLKTYSNDVLFYIPTSEDYQVNDRSIGGKAIYLRNTSADVDLFDLFGRL